MPRQRRRVIDPHLPRTFVLVVGHLTSGTDIALLWSSLEC
jgi:hypothetical protein